jgi:hypothetical protein
MIFFSSHHHFQQYFHEKRLLSLFRRNPDQQQPPLPENPQEQLEKRSQVFARGYELFGDTNEEAQFVDRFRTIFQDVTGDDFQLLGPVLRYALQYHLQRLQPSQGESPENPSEEVQEKITVFQTLLQNPASVSEADNDVLKEFIIYSLIPIITSGFQQATYEKQVIKEYITEKTKSPDELNGKVASLTYAHQTFVEGLENDSPIPLNRLKEICTGSGGNALQILGGILKKAIEIHIQRLQQSAIHAPGDEEKARKFYNFRQNPAAITEIDDADLQVFLSSSLTPFITEQLKNTQITKAIIEKYTDEKSLHPEIVAEIWKERENIFRTVFWGQRESSMAFKILNLASNVLWPLPIAKVGWHGLKRLKRAYLPNEQQVQENKAKYEYKKKKRVEKERRKAERKAYIAERDQEGRGAIARIKNFTRRALGGVFIPLKNTLGTAVYGGGALLSGILVDTFRAPLNVWRFGAAGVKKALSYPGYFVGAHETLSESAKESWKKAEFIPRVREPLGDITKNIASNVYDVLRRGGVAFGGIISEDAAKEVNTFAVNLAHSRHIPFALREEKRQELLRTVQGFRADFTQY